MRNQNKLKFLSFSFLISIDCSKSHDSDLDAFCFLLIWWLGQYFIWMQVVFIFNSGIHFFSVVVFIFRKSLRLHFRWLFLQKIRVVINLSSPREIYQVQWIFKNELFFETEYINLIGIIRGKTNAFRWIFFFNISVSQFDFMNVFLF